MFTPPNANEVEIPTIMEGDAYEVLKKAGVVFLREGIQCKTEREQEQKGAPLLQKVRLPRGWRKARFGDTSYWTALYDEKNRQRAEMFYNGGMYDNRADMRALARFHVHCEAYGEEKRRVFTARDGRDGIVIFTSSEYQQHSREEHDAIWDDHDARRRLSDEDEAASKRSMQECEAWLNSNYPQWQDKSAYWD